jgi:hypothetical protein
VGLKVRTRRNDKLRCLTMARRGPGWGVGDAEGRLGICWVAPKFFDKNGCSVLRSVASAEAESGLAQHGGPLGVSLILVLCTV